MKAQRILAYIIDAILISIAFSIICAITGLQIDTLWSSGFGLNIFYNPVTLLSIVLATLYFLTDVTSGGSPGKKLTGLQVVPKTNSGKLFPAAITRAIVKVLSIHLLIGVILFLIGDEHSSLHDKSAGTRVQRKVAIA